MITNDNDPEENFPIYSLSEALQAVETLNVFVQTHFDDVAYSQCCGKCLLSNANWPKTKLSRLVTTYAYTCIEYRYIASLCIEMFKYH